VCALEFPDLQPLADTYGDHLQVLGIAAGDDDATVHSFVEQTGVRFPTVWDDDYLRHQVAFPAHISPFPRQILVDSDGTISYIASEHSLGDLEAAVAEAVAR